MAVGVRSGLKTHDSAVEQYGEGEQAHRTAFKLLKRSFEKVDDHWERKDENGPSDPRSNNRGKAARDGRGESLGGVDYYGHTKARPSSIFGRGISASKVDRR